MLPYANQEVTPAAREHMEAQTTLLTDISKKMFSGFQKVNELNMRLAQDIMSASIQSTQQIFQSGSASEATATLSSNAQPLAESTTRYTQGLQAIAADLQVELASSAEQHIPNTKRTAAVLAQEISQRAIKESENISQAFGSKSQSKSQSTPSGQSSSTSSAFADNNQTGSNRNTSSTPKSTT
jgi:phasin family protein